LQQGWHHRNKAGITTNGHHDELIGKLNAAWARMAAIETFN
jgi:hypothetical protein